MGVPSTAVTPDRTELKEAGAPDALLKPASFSSGAALDINDNTATTAKKWDVSANVRLSVDGALITGAWGSAEIQVRGGLDGTNWTVITTITSETHTPNIDVAEYIWADLKVSVASGGAATALFKGYGYTPPF